MELAEHSLFTTTNIGREWDDPVRVPDEENFTSCAALPKIGSNVSIIALMDLFICVVIVGGGAYTLLCNTYVQDFNLLYVLCFITGLCVWADVMLLYLPNESCASALWIFTHVLIYICWIFVIFAKSRNSKVSIFEFGFVLRLILQPFLELVSLLSVYGWFTWVLALNWVKLSEEQWQQARETPPPAYDVVMAADAEHARSMNRDSGAGAGDHRSVELEQVISILNSPD